MYSRPTVAQLISKLSHEDQIAAKQTMEYLTELASRPGGRSPEGSVASVINGQSAAVRQFFKDLKGSITTERYMPFEPKQSEGEVAEKAYGLDGPTTELLVAATDVQDVCSELQNRMGTSTPDEPPSTRDIIGAAYDMHTQEAQSHE